MIWVTLIIVILVFSAAISFLVYINSRLFAYIKALEGNIEKSVRKTEDLHQSLKEVIQEGFLLDDGRLKKMAFQTDRNKIYNGITINETEAEF